MAFNNSTFSSSQDNDFFSRKSEVVNHYRSVICPCGADQTRAITTCKLCGGTGRFYPDAPIVKNAVISAVETNQANLISVGLAVPGDIVLSERINEAHPVEEYDIIIPANWGGLPFGGQIVTRSSRTTDKLYYSAESIDKCLSVDASTGAITSYVEGTDFTVVGKTLTWLIDDSENVPDEGSNYSIRYKAIFEYIVYIPALVRREKGTELGAKALLRKRHLVLSDSNIFG